MAAPMEKWYSIEFIATTDAPYTDSKERQAVNTGEEAKIANGLRGGLEDS